VPAEQAAIETMHKMRAEGATLRAIAEALASTGIKISYEGIRRVLARDPVEAPANQDREAVG
jgi:hypothetical protein